MSWHYDGEIRIKKLEIQPFGTNCYIVVCPQSGEGIIVDTPGEASRILAEAGDISVRYIIITHTHLDHLGAFQEVRDSLKAEVAVHPLEAGALPSPPDLTLEDGDVVSFGEVNSRVLHTPGHTPGSLCLLMENTSSLGIRSSPTARARRETPLLSNRSSTPSPRSSSCSPMTRWSIPATVTMPFWARRSRNSPFSPADPVPLGSAAMCYGFPPDQEA